MSYEQGKSFAWFVAFGRGYAAEFAYPGNRRTRFLKDREGKVREFPTSHEAIAAAQAQVRRVCEPDIVAAREPDEKRVAEKLGVANWKREKAELVRRGNGKQPFIKERRSIA